MVPKFRAWDIMRSEFLQNDIDTFIIAPDGTVIINRDNCNSYVEDVILIEFTGAFDINGKAIYEGDLLQGSETLHLVLWDDEKFGYYLKVLKSKYTLISNLPFPLWQYTFKDTAYDLEVIGNKFKNPELL